MKRYVTVMAMVFLLGMIAMPALARGPGGSGDPGFHPCWQGGSGYTNLTEEQRTQLDQIHSKLCETMAPLRNELHSKYEELNTLMNGPEPDPEKARELQREVSELKGKMAQERVQFWLAAKKIAPELRMNMGRGSGPHGHGGFHGGGMGCPWHEDVPEGDTGAKP